MQRRGGRGSPGERTGVANRQHPVQSVAHLGDELHLRRGERVLFGYIERQLERAALIRRARRPLCKASWSARDKGTIATVCTPEGRLSTCRCCCRPDIAQYQLLWRRLGAAQPSTGGSDNSDRLQTAGSPGALLTSFSSLNSRVLLAMAHGACVFPRARESAYLPYSTRGLARSGCAGERPPTWRCGAPRWYARKRRPTRQSVRAHADRAPARGGRHRYLAVETTYGPPSGGTAGPCLRQLCCRG